MDRDRYVETDRIFGPRGDYYEWCNLLDNGSLQFGDEQGNYCGGTILSYNFFSKNGMPCTSYPHDYPVTDEYWNDVKNYLSGIKESKPDFYDKILHMCKENNATDAIIKGFGIVDLEV